MAALYAAKPREFTVDLKQNLPAGLPTNKYRVPRDSDYKPKGTGGSGAAAEAKKADGAAK